MIANKLKEWRKYGYLHTILTPLFSIYNLSKEIIQIKIIISVLQSRGFIYLCKCN